MTPSRPPASTRISWPVRDYHLDATLDSGQVFRWQRSELGWTGILGRRWLQLRVEAQTLHAETAEPVSDWSWLRHFLQLDVDLAAVLRTFPAEASMRAATEACHGLRLLRQDPWECLASFILSSTKQIVQIRQIIALLSTRCGERIISPSGHPEAFAFPSPDRLARLSESDLRACKMGFRAPYLLQAALAVAEGKLDLAHLHDLSVEAARTELLRLTGVGRKIADCVLLFAYGFPEAFPVDVWIMKGLKQLYFPNQRVSPRALQEFAQTHFGPHAGYAQQYLFHYLRTHWKPHELA